MTSAAPARRKLLTRNFVVLTLENFLIAMNYYLLIVAVSKFATDEFGVSTALAGFSASIFVVGGLVARPLCGKWIHRVGQTGTLYAGALLSLVMTLLYFAATSVGLLLIIRFVHGASFGILTVAAGTIIAGVVPRERYGEGIGYFGLSVTVATGIGPFIGLLLGRHGSFDAIIIACSIAAAIGVLILPLLSLKDPELTKEQLEETKGVRLRNFIEPSVIPIGLVTMLLYLCYASVVSFLALYSEEIQLETAAGYFFVVYAAAMFVTRPFVGRRFDLKGENAIIYPAIPVFAAGLLVFSQARQGAVLLLAAAIIGIGLGAVTSSGQTLVAKITPPHRLGLANSTFLMLADIGVGVGPLLCGFLIAVTGYRGMYVVMTGVAAACLVLYHVLYGGRKR